MSESTVVWDKDGALRRLKQREDRLRTLLTMFIANTPERMERLQLALREKDLQQMAFVAHEIKGTAGNIGGMGLYAACARVETSVAEARADDPSLLVAAVKRECQALMDCINEYMNQNA